jgi:hypothetical protein
MDDFVRLVERMRDAQDEYFRDPGLDALVAAKKLEREVDDRIRMAKSGQKELFQ